MLRLVVLTLLVSLLHGCAFINSMRGDLPQQVEQWIKENEYAKALKTIEYVSPSNKHYALLMEKKRQIKLLVKEFENRTHVEAQHAERDLQWNKANHIYLNALDKIPGSRYLQTEYQAFIGRRDDYLQNLEFKLSISKGSWLIESNPIQKTILNAHPEDRQAQHRYQETSEEMTQTATDLLKCAETAIQAGRNALAETCLQIASELNPVYIDKNKLKKLRQQLAKTHQKRINEQNEKTRELINELKQGFSHDNLQRAQRHLATIRESDKQNRESRKLSAELSKMLKKGIDNRIESGRRLYSNGQIQNALSIWIPLQAIAPDNAKLENYIKRAKRVLAKVKKLSNKPSTVIPAQ